MRTALWLCLCVACTSGSDPRVAIDRYCDAQSFVLLPDVAPSEAGAPCTAASECASGLCALGTSEPFCTTECAADAECPTGLPSCSTVSTPRVCVPACDVFPFTDLCADELGRMHDDAAAAGCSDAYRAWLSCLDTNGPFCTFAERDAACGAARAALTTCME